MGRSAVDLLKVAKRAEKQGDTLLAYRAYSDVLKKFPSNATALKRRFDLDLLRKCDPENKSKEKIEYDTINKMLEIGISDPNKLNLEKFILDNPSVTYAYPVHARLIDKQNISRFVSMVRCVLENAKKPQHRYNLLQTLYICSKRQSHFSNAFKYLKKANDLRREYVKYNPKRDEKDIELIKKKFTDYAETSIFGTKQHDYQFIFIIGMPRSGTTLIEQTICNAKEVASVGEVPFATQFMSKVDLTKDLESITNDLSKFYVDEIKKYNLSEHIIIDKMPFNLFWTGFLALSFPNAKFIHCKRDARATCWSNYETNFAEGNHYSFKLDEIVRHYNNCEDLMLFWKSNFTDRILTLDYDAFTEVPEVVGENLFNFLKLPWELTHLSGEKNKRPVKTASQLQVRKSIYKGSSTVWKNFEPFIGNSFDPLID